MVKLLNNLAEEPNPRTKCWKVTVPYIFKDVMAVDTFFPSGWSHRSFTIRLETRRIQTKGLGKVVRQEDLGRINLTRICRGTSPTPDKPGRAA